MTPTAKREFRRQDRLLVRVPFHPASDRQPAFSARLLDRRGQRLSDVVVVVSDREAMVELSLAQLAIGDYLIEVTKGDAEKLEELVAFRIVG